MYEILLLKALNSSRSMIEPIKHQIEKARLVHHDEFVIRLGRTVLPDALAKEYQSVGYEWCWGYMFAANPRGRNPNEQF